MNASEITITQSTYGGVTQVRITFPPGSLADGHSEGCYLGFGQNCLLMTDEHYAALRERIRSDDALDVLMGSESFDALGDGIDDLRGD